MTILLAIEAGCPAIQYNAIHVLGDLVMHQYADKSPERLLVLQGSGNCSAAEGHSAP